VVDAVAAELERMHERIGTGSATRSRGPARGSMCPGRWRAWSGRTGGR